jgi:hypothetical protein
MIDKLITFLIHCPKCQHEWSSALGQAQLLEALEKGTPIRVYASCHGSWDLSESDREQLRLRLRTLP